MSGSSGGETRDGRKASRIEALGDGVFSIAMTLVYLLSIGISFWSTTLSIVLYLFVPLMSIVPGRLDRDWTLAAGNTYK